LTDIQPCRTQFHRIKISHRTIKSYTNSKTAFKSKLPCQKRKTVCVCVCTCTWTEQDFFLSQSLKLTLPQGLIKFRVNCNHNRFYSTIKNKNVSKPWPKFPLSSKLSGLEKGTLVLPNCPHFFKMPKRADYFPITYKTSSTFTDTTMLLSKCCVPTFNNSCGSVMMKCSVSLALSSATCFASFAVSCKYGKSRPAYTQIQIKVHLKNKNPPPYYF